MGMLQCLLHEIHIVEDNDGCQEGEGILMESRITQIVIVSRDEGSDPNRQYGDQKSHGRRSTVTESGVEEYACCVHHSQLIQQLHWIFESRMEDE